MATVELTTENFQKTVRDGGLVFIDFWATWCAPCRAFAPVFEKASKKHPEATWAKVDTQRAPELARALGIEAIPTLMIFRDGIRVFSQAGALPPAALDELVRQARALDMDEVRRKIGAAA